MVCTISSFTCSTITRPQLRVNCILQATWSGPSDFLHQATSTDNFGQADRERLQPAWRAACSVGSRKPGKYFGPGILQVIPTSPSAAIWANSKSTVALSLAVIRSNGLAGMPSPEDTPISPSFAAAKVFRSTRLFSTPHHPSSGRCSQGVSR